MGGSSSKKNVKSYGTDVKFTVGTYTGGLLNDKPHGQGVLTLNDGSTLEGVFHNGKKNGEYIKKTKTSITKQYYENNVIRRATYINKNSGLQITFRYNKVGIDTMGPDESDVQIVMKIPPIVEEKVDPVQLCKYFLNPPVLEKNQSSVEMRFKGSVDMNLARDEFMLLKGEISIFQTYIINGTFKDGFLDGEAQVYDFKAKKKYKAEFKHAVLILKTNEEPFDNEKPENRYVPLENKPPAQTETQEGEEGQQTI